MQSLLWDDKRGCLKHLKESLVKSLASLKEMIPRYADEFIDHWEPTAKHVDSKRILPRLRNTHSTTTNTSEWQFRRHKHIVAEF